MSETGAKAAQARREECAAYEDPRARVRACEGQAGAGRCCARARQAQTVAERLRREGARVHEGRRRTQQRLRAQLTVTYRTDITDFRITPRRVPAVDKVAMDPSAQGQGLGKEHGVCKELQGRAELQHKAVARWLLR